jgi:hypothetical protein
MTTLPNHEGNQFELSWGLHLMKAELNARTLKFKSILAFGGQLTAVNHA